MKLFKNCPFLTILLITMMLIQSCMAWRPLGKPYSQTIPRSIEPGSKIKLHLTNGADIGIIEVKEVWQDSLLVGSGNKAILITDVSLVEKKKFSIGLTLLAVGIPVGVIYAISAAMLASATNDLIK